jgi:alkylated DNA repair protein (DNA oxidative demethylase)
MSWMQAIELFQADEALVPTVPARESLAPGAMLLRGWAEPDAVALLADLQGALEQAPLRHMVTPGGFRMSVAMSNCGALGWVSESTGYRYDAVDPDSGRRWPPMPASFLRLARLTAAEAGFSGFEPDACLVNRYEPGARLTLHQDRNERDFSQPIVSVSLGLPAVFLFGGPKRSDRLVRMPLMHGDAGSVTLKAGTWSTTWANGAILVIGEGRQTVRLCRRGRCGSEPQLPMGRSNCCRQSRRWRPLADAPSCWWFGWQLRSVSGRSPGVAQLTVSGTLRSLSLHASSGLERPVSKVLQTWPVSALGQHRPGPVQ